MSRKRVWVASQPPSSVAEQKGTAATARVWVRPQSDGPAVAPAAVSPPRSAPQRPAVGLGKACLAAVLASAAAKPHSQPAAGSPQHEPSGSVYLPSPHKLLAGARQHVQAAVDRGHAPPAASLATLARQPNTQLQNSHAAGSTQVASSKRPASKTWVRPVGAALPSAEPTQQSIQAARPTAVTNSLRVSAPLLPFDRASRGDPRQVPSSLPASQWWVRADSGPAATLGRRTAASQTALVPVGVARPGVQASQVSVPSKRVWRRDDGVETKGTAVPSGDADAPAAAFGPGKASRSSGGVLPVPAGRSQPAVPAISKQTSGTSRTSRQSSAVNLAQRPRSLAWRNPDLPSAAPKHTGSASTAAAVGKTAMTATTAAPPAQRSPAGATSVTARRLMRSAATGGDLPGARAAALGRVTEGRVGKKLRSNKLQRIGEHLYRAQTGTGGRTLQRQGATPTASTRLVRPVSPSPLAANALQSSCILRSCISHSNEFTCVICRVFV